MKYAKAIKAYCRELRATSEKIQILYEDISEAEKSKQTLAELFENMFLDEVKHAKSIVLELDKLLKSE